MRKLFIGAAVLLLGVTACKPTEKGYQAAYDAALAKRQAAQQEQMLPAQGMQMDDGPQIRVVGGDSVYVDRQRIKAAEGSAWELDKFNVAVSFFKMKTNAEASAAMMKDKGYKAIAAQSARERWYVVVGEFPSLQEAVDFYKEFMKKNPDYKYIGLPGAR